MSSFKPAPELLAPAGSLAMLRTALAFGANAVYAGQPRYSLRVRNNEFGDLESLAEGIDAAHAVGSKLYVVSNIYPHNTKIRNYLADMAPVIDLKPDALIMADPGLIDMVRERWPEVPIHLSVQANTMNYAAVRFWKKLGVSRVILSRELSLAEVAEIRQECSDMELEVFVHGALCIAYSGRCLLSGYFNHRDANQGSCTNACRWGYQLHDTVDTPDGDVMPRSDNAAQRRTTLPSPPPGEGLGVRGIPPNHKAWLLEEGQRSGELMPVEEDEHGTYVLNSKDLRAIEHVQRLVDIGVDSLKIEGRTKSPYYAARTTQSYRRAIDDAVAGRPFDKRLIEELDGLANRGYTDGFFMRNKDRDWQAAGDAILQNYTRGNSLSGRSLYVGDVLGWSEGFAEIDVKNRFSVGDRIEVLHPAGNAERVIDAMLNKDGAPITVAPGNGHKVRIPLPAGCEGAFLARFV